jgi:hypothetical protein
MPRRLLGRQTAQRKQLPDTRQGCLDIGRDPLEVIPQTVEEVRERRGVEVLRAIRVFARLHPCLVELGPQVMDAPVTTRNPSLMRVQLPRSSRITWPRVCASASASSRVWARSERRPKYR